jgi:predicted methyltransferase
MLRRSLSLIGTLVFVALVAAPHAFAADTMVPAAVSAAVADAGRPDADKERDADRRPAETVAFTGIKSGDHVAELFPGRGYFTRILSKVVGGKGLVYAIAPPPRPNAPPDAPNPAAAVIAIAADASYRNVKVLQQRVTELSVPEPVDAVWTSLNYHDFHNVPNVDMKALNTLVFNALKPGGVYIVIDHAAAAGSGVRDTSTLHRIDPAAVKEELTAVGFVLDGESDVLRHPADDHTAQVREASVRGKTDQFLLKFRKPKP